MGIQKNTFAKFIENAGKILIPVVIYYFTHLLAYAILTTLVIDIMRFDSFISGGEAAMRRGLSGISALIGILPLLPSLKREISDRKEQDKNIPVYISVPITITLAITSAVALNMLFIRLHLTETSETYSRVAEHQYDASLVMGLILYGVISPLAEEVVFRGIIYNRIRKNCSIFAAVCLSALLFGLYHGNIVQGAYGFLMGVLLAYTYERFGSFFHAVLFHAAANAAVYTITSSEVLYNFIMTPYFCAVFVFISAFLLWWMRMRK